MRRGPLLVGAGAPVHAVGLGQLGDLLDPGEQPGVRGRRVGLRGVDGVRVRSGLRARPGGVGGCLGLSGAVLVVVIRVSLSRIAVAQCHRPPGPPTGGMMWIWASHDLVRGTVSLTVRLSCYPPRPELCEPPHLLGVSGENRRRSAAESARCPYRVDDSGPSDVSVCALWSGPPTRQGPTLGGWGRAVRRIVVLGAGWPRVKVRRWAGGGVPYVGSLCWRANWPRVKVRRWAGWGGLYVGSLRWGRAGLASRSDVGRVGRAVRRIVVLGACWPRVKVRTLGGWGRAVRRIVVCWARAGLAVKVRRWAGWGVLCVGSLRAWTVRDGPRNARIGFRVGRGGPLDSLLASRRARRPVEGHQPALVAQRIEHLTTDQKVGGSNPSERAM